MVLVTGATGILGRVIALELLKNGKTVRATKRKSSNLKEVRDSYQFYTDQPDFYFDKIQWIDNGQKHRGYVIRRQVLQVNKMYVDYSLLPEAPDFVQRKS